MGKYFVTIFLLVTLKIIVPDCMAATDEYETAARAFAHKQLQDPNTFCPAPPSDLNPYKEMSQEEIKNIKSRARRNGCILCFHLNGVPALFMSNADGKKNGLERAWYESGRVKYEEYYNEDKLVDGSYFDQLGSKLGEVKEGTGVKFIFLGPYEMQGRLVGFAEYKDGAKHGVETIYRDYEKKIKSRERHYKEGKLHGVATDWMSSGQKNNEKHYKDGVKHGKSTNWYEDGKTRYIIEYANGKTTGGTIRYYETGIKSHESSAKEKKKWFPSGKLMVHTVKDEDGSVVSGQSFDRLGNETGKVVNRVGDLIEVNDSNLSAREPFMYHLFVYKPDQAEMSTGLPRAKVMSKGYSTEHPDMNFDIVFQVGSFSKWQGGTVTLLLPDGCSTDDKLKFTVDSSADKKDIELGSVEITLPAPYDKWEGSILADVDGIVKGHKVRYQQVVVQHKVEKEKPRPRSNRPRIARARQTTGNSLKTSKYMPHNAGQIVPTNARIVDSWRLFMPDRQMKEWALYRSPAMLLIKDGKDEDWKVVRNDFDYRPGGMVVHGEDYMLVWGTEATKDVSNGIPYHVEKSLDGGKTWSTFEIPKVDFLLGIRIVEENGVMIYSGIRIPKDGIAAGMDWYEIKPVMMFSKDGVNFVEQVGSSFFDFGRGKIVTRSVAPNGKYKAFISAFHGMDSTSYSLSFVKAQDEIPEQIVSVPEKSEIVWSADSQILAIKKNDEFVACYDVKADKTEEVFTTSGRRQSEKNKRADLDFDQKVRALLKQKN